MSHIHLPDGVLPAWLWLSGYVLSALLIAVLWRGGRATAEPRRFALLGVFSAMMTIVMMIEIPPVSYHFNLSVVSGVVLGPQLSVIAALMVNTILALVGHGGITVIGLNTLILSIEMIVGHYAFRALRAGRLGVSAAAFISVILGLGSGTAAGYGVIVLGAPWIDAALRQASIRGGVELGPGIGGASLNLTRLVIIMFGVGAIGWVLEGMLTAAILSYLEKVYPELLGEQSVRVP